jgi:GT2 family glycosyltransferase
MRGRMGPGPSSGNWPDVEASSAPFFKCFRAKVSRRRGRLSGAMEQTTITPVRPVESAVETIDVSILIVNWNAKNYLRNCLRSIIEQTRAYTYEIIVADNDSDDGSQEMLRTEFPSVRTIFNDSNPGFAGGNNQCMELARGRYVLLINPDTLVLDGAIDTCIEYADSLRDTKVGVLGCQVWEDEDTIQKTCFMFPSPLNTLLTMSGMTRRFTKSKFLSRSEMRWWDRRDEREVDVVSGTFMLVRRDALEEVGPMDDSYFMYAEEADWCYRFREHGWSSLFTPRARIMHLEGGGKSTQRDDLVSANMYVQLQKSLLRFHRKNRGLVSWLLAKSVYAVVMPLRAAVFGVLAVIARNDRWRLKSLQSVAATRYHLLRIEPRG